MDRLMRTALPMLALAGTAALIIWQLPAKPDGAPRAQAGLNQPAATEAGALSLLCAGWGRARLDCAAFVTHHLQNRDDATCLPPPAALAEWTIAALATTPPDAPWAPVLDAAITPGTANHHPLPCAPSAPAEKAEPT